jgi:hypothetical protein
MHVALEEFKENLATLVLELKGAGVPHLLLMTPPPVYEGAQRKENAQVGFWGRCC